MIVESSYIWTDREKLRSLAADVSVSPEHFSRTHNPDWQATISNLNKLATLEDDWDFEGAERPKPAALEIAVSLINALTTQNSLPEPSRILPTPEGGLIFEWKVSKLYIEAEITPDKCIEWMTHHEDGTFSHEEQRLADRSSSSVAISDSSDHVTFADAGVEQLEAA